MQNHNKSTSNTITFRYISAALLITLCSPLLAQEVTPASQHPTHSTSEKSFPAVIDEVIVTAQMRAQNAQSVPIAMGIYNADLIANVGANSVMDMEYAMPNINFGSGGRNTRGEIAIRGVGAYSRNVGSDARVVVYVDGVLTGRSSSFDQSLLEVERIEVLRGPQGTLSGANAIVGAINIITKTPNNTPSAELMSELGNFDRRAINGKLNLPLTENLYASLTASQTTQTGYIQNISNQRSNNNTQRDLQNINRDTATLKFHYVGVDRLTLDMGFDYLNDDSLATNAEALGDIGPFLGYSQAPKPYEVAHNADEFEQRELKGKNITARYLLPNDFQLISISGLREATFRERSEEDYSSLDVASSLFDETSRQLSHEIRLVSPNSETIDYVAGLYFLNQDISTQRSASFGKDAQRPFIPNKSVTTPTTAQVTSYSFYANGNWRFTKQWEATGGIRFIHESKNIDYSSIDGTKLFVNLNHLRESKEYNEVLPKIGLNYHLDEDALLYTSISRGYRSGGWNADFISTLENFQFNPEYAVNYELGAKSTLAEHRVTLNASLFSTKFHDFQILQFLTTSSGSTLITYTNAGKVTSQGLEVEANAKLTTHLTASLNAAFTQAKFDEFKNGGGLGIHYDGNYLPFAPKESYYAAFDYRRTLTQKISFYGHLDYGYSGNYFSHPDNSSTNSIEGHFIANSRVGVTLGSDWDISLWLKNLTNESNLRQRSVSFLRVPRGYYDPPRLFGITFRYSF